MSDRLKAGQSLAAGQRLTSNNRRFALILQKDGNLVLVDDGGIPRGIPYWATGSSSKNLSHMDLKDDGDLVIYDKKGMGIWSLRKHDLNASHLIVQDDGNIVIYRKDRGVIWSPNKVRSKIVFDPPVGTIVIDAENAEVEKGNKGLVVITNDAGKESVVKSGQVAIEVDQKRTCSLAPANSKKPLTALVYKVVNEVVKIPGQPPRTITRRGRQITTKKTTIVAVPGPGEASPNQKLTLSSKGKLS